MNMQRIYYASISTTFMVALLAFVLASNADTFNSLSGQVSSANTVSFITISSGFNAATSRRNLFQVPTASFDLDADTDTNPNIAEIDNDNDGLTDTAELFTYLSDHNDTDTDEDTLPDGLEVLTYNTSPTSNDTDTDMLTDQYEVANLLDPTTNDSSMDKDGDGYSNLQEFQNDTDPSRYILKLNKGWNLMSLARIPAINNVSSILKGNKTGIVWGWDDLQLKVADQFDPLKGFWVYAPADADVEIQLP